MSQDSGHILLVDDDIDIREALAEVLEDEGFRVQTAANGLEALQLLRGSAPPKIILLDLMMPVMDGYQFLEEQRKDASLAAIPVAIITAGAGLDRSRLGDAILVPKPIKLPQLLSVLEPIKQD